MLEKIINEKNEIVIVPDTFVMTLWRNALSMTYMHPTLLFHPGMAPLRSIFVENNVIHESATANIFIPIPAPKHPTQSLRPQFTYPEVALQAVVGEIHDCIMDEKGILVRDFSLCEAMKIAVVELAEFIRTYPQALYEETYGFIYDFLVRFGIMPKVIESLVEKSIEFSKRRKIVVAESPKIVMSTSDTKSTEKIIIEDSDPVVTFRKHVFRCPTCKKFFPSQTVLRSHSLSTHAGRYICHYCEKAFVVRQSLRRHHFSNHPKETLIISAPKTKRSFTQSNDEERVFKRRKSAAVKIKVIRHDINKIEKQEESNMEESVIKCITVAEESIDTMKFDSEMTEEPSGGVNSAKEDFEIIKHCNPEVTPASIVMKTVSDRVQVEKMDDSPIITASLVTSVRPNVTDAQFTKKTNSVVKSSEISTASLIKREKTAKEVGFVKENVKVLKKVESESTIASLKKVKSIDNGSELPKATGDVKNDSEITNFVKIKELFEGRKVEEVDITKKIFEGDKESELTSASRITQASVPLIVLEQKLEKLENQLDTFKDLKKKYGLRKVTIDLFDCLKDRHIVEQYFPNKIPTNNNPTQKEPALENLVQKEQRQNRIKTEERQDLIKTEEREDFIKTGLRQDLIKTGQRNDLIKTGQRQDLIKTGHRQDLIKSQQPQDLVKTRQRQDLVKTQQRQDLTKTQQRQDIAKTQQRQDITKTQQRQDITKTQQRQDNTKTQQRKDVIRTQQRQNELKIQERKIFIKNQQTQNFSKKVPARRTFVINSTTGSESSDEYFVEKACTKVACKIGKKFNSRLESRIKSKEIISSSSDSSTSDDSDLTSTDSETDSSGSSELEFSKPIPKIQNGLSLPNIRRRMLPLPVKKFNGNLIKDAEKIDKSKLVLLPKEDDTIQKRLRARPNINSTLVSRETSPKNQINKGNLSQKVPVEKPGIKFATKTPPSVLKSGIMDNFKVTVEKIKIPLPLTAGISRKPIIHPPSVEVVRIQRQQSSCSNHELNECELNSDESKLTNPLGQQTMGLLPTTLATTLPKDLGEDCSEDFIQKLLYTFHQVEESEPVVRPNGPFDFPSPENGFPVRFYTPSREEKRPRSKKMGTSESQRKINDSNPKVIVQPVNSCVQLPATFIRNISKTSSSSSSRSNAL